MTDLLQAFNLADKQAVVTGGGSGLGLAIATTFSALGARVVIVGRREDILRDAVKNLGPLAGYHVTDITDPLAVEALVASVEHTFGHLDILVNNAGNHVKKSYEDMTLADMHAVLDTHVVAGFYLTKLCLPMLRQSSAASVLFIASMAAYLGVPNIIGYTAAKSAVLGLVRGTAAELSGSGIRVNGIAPGWISTPMTDQALAGDPHRRAKILARTPMGRMGEPGDIGLAAAYLSSPAAQFVCGHTLVVDGGAVNGF